MGCCRGRGRSVYRPPAQSSKLAQYDSSCRFTITSEIVLRCSLAKFTSDFVQTAFVTFSPRLYHL